MPHFDDIDPADAQTAEELADYLKQVRARADSPSLRDLEQRARRAGHTLPRSSVADMLAAKRLPRKELLLAYLEACGLNPAEDPRWHVAWNRLAARKADPAAQIRRSLDDSLINDIRTAGLVRIGTTYLTGLQWSNLFADVTELDISFAYGQTWTRMHARDIARVGARPGARIRVVLADPDDYPTVRVLAGRFSLTDDELRHRVRATLADYTAFRTEGGATIEIYYRAGDRIFSFYRLDDTAVIGFYSHSRNRTANVPTLVCQQPGELFDFVLEEWEAIISNARPAY